MGTGNNPQTAADDAERAKRIAEQAERRNDDPQTTREAMEQELEQQGLSDEGRHIGQHID
jgi:hypothetical protein